MLQTSNSFFVTAPIVMLAFLRPKNYNTASVDPIGVRFIWMVTLAYAIFYCLVAPKMGSTGIHWGNRYLIVLYPLFAILSAINLVLCFKSSRKIAGWPSFIMTLVIMISFAGQLLSIDILYKKKKFSYHANKEAAKIIQPVIITNVWWIPLTLYSEFYEKMFFYVSPGQRMSGLLRRLSAKGYNQFVFVTQPGEKKASSEFAVVDDEGLNFFTLNFFLYTIHYGAQK